MSSYNILSSGMALSSFPVSGSHEMADVPLFYHADVPTAKFPIQIQGFYWNGLSTLTVKDANYVTLFTGTKGPIYPGTASGSYGLIVNAPLYVSADGPAGGGGTLIVYGKVL